MNKFSSKNRSIETMMPQNYVPHVQNSAKSIKKGQINLSDVEEMVKPTVPYVESNMNPSPTNSLKRKLARRYLQSIRNPRNFDRINQLNEEIYAQKLAEFILSQQ